MRHHPVESLLPERLRQVRKKQNLTQRELARLSGLGINHINWIESGAGEPVVGNLMKIANVLGVSIDYLVGLSDDPHGPAPASDLNIYEREMVETFRREGWPGVIRLGGERLSK